MVHHNFIDGSWLEGSSVTRNINPSNTDDVVGEYTQADTAQAQAAIAAAKAAFPGWRAATPQQRADALDRIGTEILARKDELGRLLSREEGKTLPEGIGEAGRAGPDLQVLRRPGAGALGRSGAIDPTRHHGRGHPRALGRGRPDHALELPDRDPGLEDRAGTGASAIAWCSSPPTSSRARPGRWPRSSAGRACRRACSTWSWAAARWSARPSWPRPTWRRSASPARSTPAAPIAAKCAAGLKKFQLEMGGKNPLVVLDDADLKTAVGCAVQGAFYSTGQRCTASSRLIVTKGIHDRFVTAVTDELKALVVDDALKPGTQIGPVVDQRPARPGPALHRDRAPGAGEARLGRRAAEPRDARLLPAAGPVHRDRPTRCGSIARRSSGPWRP